MKKTTKKIILYVIEVIIILLVAAGLAIFKYWPEYQKTLGSSDRMFSYEKYQSILGINISAGPEYFLILDKENQISNIFFKNTDAFVLYNQDIERKKITKAIPLMMQKLQEGNYLTKDITITTYDNSTFQQQVKQEITKYLETISSNILIIENTSTLELLAKELGITAKDEKDIMLTMFIASSDLISAQKHNISKKDSVEPVEENLPTLSEATAKTYANDIYQKLQTYITAKNIKDQIRDDPNMPIQLLPADNSGEIFPDISSWYYVKEYQVYAEISFKSTTDLYSFCYNGSLKQVKKGKCEV